MSDLKTIATLLKAGPEGEGSRGGNVIGHTKSGKPIYGHHLHEGHMGFNMDDHKDAANFHTSVVDAAIDKLDAHREKNPDFATPQKVIDFLNYHRKQAQFHQSKANQKMDIRDRNQRQIAEVMREQAMGITRKDRPIKKSESPYYVGLVVVNPLGEVLIGKRQEDGLWTGPGGGADPMESPSQAAIREAYEEANLHLREDQLEEVIAHETENGKICHCFIAYTLQDMDTIHSDNDPDNEVKKWEWHKLSDLPKDYSKSRDRMTTMNHARMKIMGLKKSEVAMNDEHGNPSIETSDYSIDEAASKDSMWFTKFTEAMKDYAYGQEPVDIDLPNGHNMSLVKVDDGIYSGFVKKVDDDGLPETVLQVEKLPIPTIIQFLRAKEVITPEPEPVEQSLEEPQAIEASMEEPMDGPQEEQDAHGIEELLAVLSQFRGEGNTININFYKGKSEEQ